MLHKQPTQTPHNPNLTGCWHQDWCHNHAARGVEYCRGALERQHAAGSQGARAAVGRGAQRAGNACWGSVGWWLEGLVEPVDTGVLLNMP